METLNKPYELKPHTCPICRGSGSVPAHFYIENRGTSLAGEVTCRACQGVGYIVC